MNSPEISVQANSVRIRRSRLLRSGFLPGWIVLAVLLLGAMSAQADRRGGGGWHGGHGHGWYGGGHSSWGVSVGLGGFWPYYGWGGWGGYDRYYVRAPYYSATYVTYPAAVPTYAAPAVAPTPTTYVSPEPAPTLAPQRSAPATAASAMSSANSLFGR